MCVCVCERVCECVCVCVCVLRKLFKFLPDLSRVLVISNMQTVSLETPLSLSMAVAAAAISRVCRN